MNDKEKRKLIKDITVIVLALSSAGKMETGDAARLALRVSTLAGYSVEEAGEILTSASATLDQLVEAHRS